MNVHKNQSLGARLQFALAGLRHAIGAERSLRFQLLALAGALALLAYLRPAAVWWAVVLLTCSGVIAAELFNTALERLADHLHPGIHPQIRRAKDCAAAAVLVLAAGAVAVAVALIVGAWRRS